MALLCILLAIAGALVCWYGAWHADATSVPKATVEALASESTEATEATEVVPDSGASGASTISVVDQWLERAGKVVVPIALIGVVVFGGGLDRPGGLLLAVALAFVLVGDIALLNAAGRAFLTGLGAFALAQVAFISSFVAAIRAYGVTWWMALLGLAFAGLFAATAGRRIQDRVTVDEGTPLGYGVLGYLVLITITAAVAGGTGRWFVLVGAMLFVVSDVVLGLDRFVGPRPRSGLVVLTTYHLALAGFTAGIVA